MDNHCIKAEDNRSLKRIALAKQLANTLDITGLDSVSRNVDGFTIKSTRSQYDDEVAHPSVSSPAGMFLIVARNGGYDVHSSESLQMDSYDMGRLQDTDGTEVSIYDAPANMQIVGAPGELVSIYSTSKQYSSGSNPYLWEVMSIPAISKRRL